MNGAPLALRHNVREKWSTWPKVDQRSDRKQSLGPQPNKYTTNECQFSSRVKMLNENAPNLGFHSFNSILTKLC